ncbi:ABC transporter permease [Saccharopolyspora oryzae]|uniref:ABC transporter permease n=1 Tax=Saccharopolyspora oryzae TaxID=2997343 RepID=A0ABT4V6U8_9PSEU|nr:ABC transporter permease [Saccharopolyspora oryzae]MDA3629012.1 ABC transporter permease [Saccharopolyspora oryzae]
MTDVASAPAPSAAGGKRKRKSKPEPADSEILRLSHLFDRGFGGIPVLLLIAFGLSLATDSFLSGTNLDNLGRQVSIYAIIAVGQLLVILTAGIDLSVGSVVGLAGVVAATAVFETTGGLPVALSVVLALIVGAGAGLINGVLVAVLRMPPFIVTLGMMGIARGATLLLTDGRTVQPLPAEFTAIAGGSLFGVSNLTWLMLLVTVVMAWLLRRTVWGQYVYAVGSNVESARLTGVPVRAVLLSAYALSGLLAAFAGVLLASRLGNGVPTSGTGYELQAIAACVIGGASLFGAKGTALGALVGALVVGLLNNGGTLLGVDPFWLQIAIGVLILIAVGAENLRGGKSRGLPGMAGK